MEGVKCDMEDELKLVESEVRNDIEARNLIDDLPYYSEYNTAYDCAIGNAKRVSVAGYDNRQINENIESMQINADNRAYRNIYSCRKIIGGLIVFAKRVVRKLLKWYLEPVCDQQSDFNLATVNAVRCFSEISTVLQMDVISMQRKVEVLCCQQSDMLEMLGSDNKFLDDIGNRLVTLECAFRLYQEEKKKNECKIVTLEKKIESYKEENDEKSISCKETIQTLKDVIASLETNMHEVKENVNEVEANMEQVEESITCVHENVSEKCKSIASSLNVNINDLREQCLEAQQLVKDNSDRLHNIERILSEAGPRYEFGSILSSAQSGEDTIVAYILDSLKVPFNACTYLDIGANHAKAMSNTYMFYRFGARGVLVEANPALIEELKIERKGDIILNYCISEKSGEEVNLYVLNGDGLSSPSLDYALKCIKSNESLKIDSVAKVNTITISEVISRYFRELPVLVSLDIEGDEIGILKGMDLMNNRIKIVIVETISYSARLNAHSKNQDLVNFMLSVGYIEYAFTGINSIFVDKKWFDLTNS